MGFCSGSIGLLAFLVGLSHLVFKLSRPTNKRPSPIQGWSQDFQLVGSNTATIISTYFSYLLIKNDLIKRLIKELMCNNLCDFALQLTRRTFHNIENDAS